MSGSNPARKKDAYQPSARAESAAAGAHPDLTITRYFDAPRPLVFQAWTDPAHLAVWWGPRGFSNPRCEFEARPGGAIHIDMRGPDGTVFPMTGQVREIVPPERLVFTSAALDAEGQVVLENLNTVRFTERSGGTEVHLHVRVLRSTPLGDEYLKGMRAGWTESLARLDEQVTAHIDTSDERAIALTRVYDAPRELVWRAWTDPEHVAQWWGPTGFTTTTKQFDVRPGGQWRFVMHGPDGTDYPNLITYLEVKEPELIRYKHGGEADCEPVNFEVAVRLEKAGADGEKTRLSIRMSFPSAAARDFVIREYGALEGAKQTFGRLGEYVVRMRAAAGGAESQVFVISRVYRAPRQAVWDAWTKVEHLQRWFGPKGMTMPECRLELRPGGVLHYLLSAPSGGEMWGVWVFREIVPPERLVYVSSFSDAGGGVARAPFSADWPLETLTTVTFAEHAGKGRGTVLRIEAVPINATDAERKIFASAFKSMEGGWTGTLEQLETYLAQNG